MVLLWVVSIFSILEMPVIVVSRLLVLSGFVDESEKQNKAADNAFKHLTERAWVDYNL